MEERYSYSYKDEDSYIYHHQDVEDRCFLCRNKKIGAILIARQVKTMLLVHLCVDCMLDNMADYLLDNTRPWSWQFEEPSSDPDAHVQPGNESLIGRR